MNGFIEKIRGLIEKQAHTTSEIGSKGEQMATLFLKKEGYQILIRNYRSKWGEIDLVCRHQKTLVFVEVKARSSEEWGRPSEAVTESKKRRIIRTAYAYLRELNDPLVPVRFDIVEVFLQRKIKEEQCNLIQHAFETPESLLGV